MKILTDALRIAFYIRLGWRVLGGRTLAGAYFKKLKKNMAPLLFADHVTKKNIGPGDDNGYGYTYVCVWIFGGHFRRTELLEN